MSLKHKNVNKKKIGLVLFVPFIDKKNEEAFVEDKLQESELEVRIYSIVKSLPSQCPRIFEMSRFDGVPNQEIADHLSLSKRTVETQISKALKVLRQHLKEYVTIFILILGVW